MIFLDVKQYCHNCIHFEAAVQSPTVIFKNDKPIHLGDFVVHCKHRDICERMRIQFSHPNEEDLK